MLQPRLNRFSLNQIRLNDEPLRCRSDVVKRIAGHQGQARIIALRQQTGLVAIDDMRRRHPVPGRSRPAVQVDHIPGADVA